MSCEPTRIELSKDAATEVQVTVTPDPGDGTAVGFVVSGLSITAAGTTTSGSVTFTIAAVTADDYSIWDAVLQVGSNAPADASAVAVPTAGTQTVGVTIDGTDVSYCAGTGGGLPSLPTDNLFVGDASNEAVATAMSTINLSEFNNDLSFTGGGNDYLSKPTYTNNQVRLFDDLYSCTPDKIDQGLNQWWLMSGGSGVAPADYVTSEVRGATQLLITNTANRRYAFWGPMFLTGADPADGDKLLWETRARLEDQSATGGALRIGLIDWATDVNLNDMTPYSSLYTTFDFACIAIDLAETNLTIGNKDTGSAGNGTKTDLGGSYPKSSYVDTFVRLAVYAEYNATDADWDLTFYVNGTSVHTLSMSFASALVPYVGMGMTSQLGQHAAQIDWISYQVKQGSPPSGRVTHVDIDAVGS